MEVQHPSLDRLRRVVQGSKRTWTAPDPNPTGFFKVRILLRWKNAAGNTVGNAKIEYDYYQGKWNGNTDQRSDYCLQDW